MSGWIDGHLDLAYLAVNGRDLRRRCGVDGCVSLPDLADGPVTLAFATIFTEPGGEDAAGYAPDDPGAAEAAGVAQLRVYERLEDEGRVRIVRGAEDLEGSESALRVVLLMEGADPIRGAGDVRRWREAGVRIVGLTWSRGTRYAGGNATGGPLTARGIELVDALDEAGIIHDASHLSDAAFDGLLDRARGPVVATHSNCRAVLGGGNERHLRDEQIEAIARRGGIVGLNLFGRFLAHGRRARVDDAVVHVEHVATVMGHRRGVGLGSDMDGGFAPEALPEGLEHPRRLRRLAAALRERGWATSEVEGFRGGNWRRLLRRHL